MGRRLRYIPDVGALVEVTCRTLHSRYHRSWLAPIWHLFGLAGKVRAQLRELYGADLVGIGWAG